MSDRNSLRAEIEEMRCLFEQQQVELMRLKRRVEVQFHHMAAIQVELKKTQAALMSAPRRLSLSPTQLQGDDNRDGHRDTSPPSQSEA